MVALVQHVATGQTLLSLHELGLTYKPLAKPSLVYPHLHILRVLLIILVLRILLRFVATSELANVSMLLRENLTGVGLGFFSFGHIRIVVAETIRLLFITSFSVSYAPRKG